MLSTYLIVSLKLKSKIEVPMDVRYSRFGDMTSSGENGLNLQSEGISIYNRLKVNIIRHWKNKQM